MYIAVWRLCVFHKLLAFPVTGGGSNIGVIELSWHHSEEHSGVGGQRVAALAASPASCTVCTVGRSNLALGCKGSCTYAGFPLGYG